MGARNIAVKDGGSWVKARATNATSTSFSAPAATTTKPSGDGVVNLRRFGTIPEWVAVLPFGTGDADDVFEMWITGWRKIGTLWIPNRLVKLTCTLGTAVGVAGTAVVATELFADTITASGGIANVSYQLFSPTDNTPAHALVAPNGCELLEFTFDTTTGDPTGCNALVARL